MSNEKSNIQNLIGGIAGKTGETKKDAELFLREFVALIQETLLQDKVVKVKGLGVFKLLWNDSRRSVNVQTGEEIEIAEHYKVSFVPEMELKEFVNQPFAHLETITLDDNGEQKTLKEELPNPLTGLSSQAQEIALMLAEIKSMPKETEIEQDNTNDITTMEIVIPPQPSQEHSNPALPLELVEPVQKEVIYQQEEKENAETEEKITEENPPKKKKRGCLWILLVLLTLLIAGVVLCYFTPNCQCYVWQYIGDAPKTTGTVWADSIKALEQDTITTTQEEQPYYPETEINEEETTATPPYSFDINGYPAENVTVGKGSRLAQLSRVHYGHYIFWGYIYLANRDKLSSPDAVEPGMQLRIPQLPKSLTDTNNSHAMEQAQYINAHLDEY